MSVWVDIHKRSNGDLERKEETVPDTSPYATKDLIDSIRKPIVYAGLVNQQSAPVATQGVIYVVNEDCVHNGITFTNGTIVIYDGKQFVTVGYNTDHVASAAIDIDDTKGKYQANGNW